MEQGRNSSEIVCEDPVSAHPELFTELAELGAYIRKVRSDLASIGPVSSKQSQIKKATTQLDQVVEATERAANQIMDACDTLQAVASDVGGDSAQKINGAVTTIYEACGFQDLTGQRIVIVNNTLSYVEGKLEELVDMLGVTPEEHGEVQPVKAELDDADLLNGPALAHEANDQSAIDRLLSELG